MSRGALLLVALLALPALAGAAEAQGAAPPAAQRADLALGTQGGEATLHYPFALAADGEVYVKVVPTPWSPVLPAGLPNGSVAADRSAGLRGWWVHLVLERAEGPPVDLGHFADDGASRAVALPGGVRHALAVTVHAPASAGPQGSTYRLDLALAHRDGANQGALDASWGLRADLVIAQATPAPLALDLTLPLLATAGVVAALAAVVAARRLRGRRQDPWF